MASIVKLLHFSWIVALHTLSLPLLLVPRIIVGFSPQKIYSPRKPVVDRGRSMRVFAGVNAEVEYTSIRPNDIPKLAKMISANFDGPYSWWQKIFEIYSVWTLECQLSDRFEKFMMNRERKHLMLVARVEGVAVGFVEVGLVPLAQELRKMGETSLNTQWGQMGINDKAMFPYFGNVVVDESFRRKGIALSLMTQALKSTKEWGLAYAFCAVHTENEAASDLYLNKLGFRIFRLEKNNSGFMNPDKRSRYILVKDFNSESNGGIEEKENGSDHMDCETLTKTNEKNTANMTSMDDRADRREMGTLAMGSADSGGSVSRLKALSVFSTDMLTTDEDSELEP